MSTTAPGRRNARSGLDQLDFAEDLLAVVAAAVAVVIALRRGRARRVGAGITIRTSDVPRAARKSARSTWFLARRPGLVDDKPGLGRFAHVGAGLGERALLARRASARAGGLGRTRGRRPIFSRATACHAL